MSHHYFEKGQRGPGKTTAFLKNVQRENAGLRIRVEELERFRAITVDAACALRRPGGCLYDDVPKHIKEYRDLLEELVEDHASGHLVLHSSVAVKHFDDARELLGEA